MLESQGCVQGQRRKQGGHVCAALVSRGFSNLPTLAASHTYSLQNPISHIPPILQTFLGKVGRWGVTSLQYYIKYYDNNHNRNKNKWYGKQSSSVVCRVLTWIDPPLLSNS